MPVQQNPGRGFDHGMFIPLLLMFPDANIPVVQLSLHTSLDPQVHLQVGQAIEALRDEGVLIIGSGMSFHNMRAYGDPRFGPVSDEFDRWLTSAVEAEPQQRHQALVDWAHAPSARLSHPPRAEEHLLPLMVVAGAAGQGRTGASACFLTGSWKRPCPPSLSGEGCGRQASHGAVAGLKLGFVFSPHPFVSFFASPRSPRTRPPCLPSGSGGDFLFRRFGIADAMFAPMVLPALQPWVADASAETERIERFERHE